MSLVIIKSNMANWHRPSPIIIKTNKLVRGAGERVGEAGAERWVVRTESIDDL